MLLNRRKLKTFVTLARQTLEITPRETGPVVRFSERGDTFTIAATHNNRWIEYRERGEFEVACFALPWLDVVKAAKVRSREMAFLTEENSIRLEWTASGRRQSRDFAIDPEIGNPSFPAPRSMTVIKGELLSALREAGQTTDRDSIRYALHCLCLRGKQRDLVATDNFQLLIQAGFDWPWEEDLLIPASRVFRSPDLRAADQAGPVQIGRTEQHVVFRFGPWRIGLPIETGARFPDLDLVIPSARDTRTRLSLSQRDRQFLREVLSEAEDADEEGEVTLDLNGVVVIRSPHKGDSPGCEWMLKTSRRTGDEISINSDDKYLRRALELGTSEIELSDSHSAFVARNELTTFIWMPLRGDPIPRSDRHRRIDSSGDEVVPELTPTPPTRKQAPMPQNGTTPGRKTSSDSTPAVTETDPVDQLIEQATGIKTKLKDLQTDLQDLINSLKAQKKQARLVRTTLDSLQKLKTLKV